MNAPRRQRQAALGTLLGATSILTALRMLPLGTPPVRPDTEANACAQPRSSHEFLALPQVTCGTALADSGGPPLAPARVRMLMGQPLDLNSASARDLSDLPGVGPRLAERMVKHRQDHGPYASVEALTGVRGVGTKTLERLAPYLTAR